MVEASRAWVWPGVTGARWWGKTESSPARWGPAATSALEDSPRASRWRGLNCMGNETKPRRKPGRRLTEAAVRKLLDEWKDSSDGVHAFLHSRGVLPRTFFYALQRLNFADDYQECRARWQETFDRNAVQTAMTVILKALADGDVSTAIWLLERRVPFLFGKPEFQLALLEKAAANNGHLRGFIDPAAVGCPLHDGQQDPTPLARTLLPLPPGGNGGNGNGCPLRDSLCSRRRYVV
jgi:hypothetical protein